VQQADKLPSANAWGAPRNLKNRCRQCKHHPSCNIICSFHSHDALSLARCDRYLPVTTQLWVIQSISYSKQLIHQNMSGFSTVIIALSLLHGVCAFYIGGRNGNFPLTRRKQSTRELFSVRLDDVKIQSDSGPVLGPRTTLENYQHKNFTLSYLYKAASPGREKDKPIVLVHPVGIGLSSWFWTKLMDSYEDNPPIYAPDLIGCGIDHGSDEWNPNEVSE
jgi:hypothetical protein